MAKYQETNVQVPGCAATALGNLMAAHNLSRDEMLRRLLSRHVERQQALPEDDRLTHISTVLRYPPPPRHRGEESIALRLRLRLPPGLAEAARGLSLLLPGQSPRRGHRDYQARSLADAVVTAIVVEHPFDDEVLSGLLPLLRHRSVHGLWRLVVAATTTRAEASVIKRGDQRSLDVAHFLEEDVAWHDRFRYEMVDYLARKLLGLPNVDEREQLRHEQMLYDQKPRGWGGIKQSLERRDPEWFAGAPVPSRDFAGRGGAAVWRAERRVELREIGLWLLRGPTRTHKVEPPGWTLRIPTSWKRVAVPIGEPLPRPLATLIQEDRALQMQVGSQQLIWPVLSISDPVPSLHTVIKAAGPCPAVEIAEALLLNLDRDYIGPVLVPAHRAHNLGLIDLAVRDQLVANARDATSRNMRDVIDANPHLEPAQRSALIAAMTSPALFARLVQPLGARGPFVQRPLWLWKVRSLATELANDASVARIRWLTPAVMRLRQRALEQSMEDAGRLAFERTRPRWID
ncbi:hypothetical protein [Kribbella sp. NPDC049227]|uniref:hypothetical protein n=1 Tax=Kribbella sp. NPDC049227 TaxID=3364113 RepID=UPI003713E4CC